MFCVPVPQKSLAQWLTFIWRRVVSFQAVDLLVEGHTLNEWGAGMQPAIEQDWLAAWRVSTLNASASHVQSSGGETLQKLLWMWQSCHITSDIPSWEWFSWAPGTPAFPARRCRQGRSTALCSAGSIPAARGGSAWDALLGNNLHAPVRALKELRDYILHRGFRMWPRCFLGKQFKNVLYGKQRIQTK